MKRIFGWGLVLTTLFVAYKVAGIGGLILSIIPLTILITIFASRNKHGKGLQGADFSDVQEQDMISEQDELIIPDASETGLDWQGLPY